MYVRVRECVCGHSLVQGAQADVCHISRADRLVDTVTLIEHKGLVTTWLFDNLACKAEDKPSHSTRRRDDNTDSARL